MCPNGIFIRHEFPRLSFWAAFLSHFSLSETNVCLIFNTFCLFSNFSSSLLTIDTALGVWWIVYFHPSLGIKLLLHARAYISEKWNNGMYNSPKTQFNYVKASTRKAGEQQTNTKKSTNSEMSFCYTFTHINKSGRARNSFILFAKYDLH